MAVSITSFQGLSNLTNLYQLNLAANDIIDLDITGCVNLSLLNISSNQLVSLDLTPLTSLTEVNVASNPNLNSLSITTLNSCTYFNAGNCALNSSFVNSILVALDNNGLEGSYYCFLSGGTNGIPSSAGITAANNLTLRGWTVTYNT